MSRAAILVILLALSGCEGVSQWLAGVGNEDYTWRPLPGSAHANATDRDLKECLDEAHGDAVGTDACMRMRGYQKYYGVR